MEIKITIENKHCTVQGTPVIVCGNSDYTVAFDFDAEWDQAGEKTARFSYVRDGARMYQDVPITGSTAEVPAVYRTREVQVGVYAGDLVTSTPARIPCEKSIVCDTCTPEDLYPGPAEELRAELEEVRKDVEELKESGTGGGGSNLNDDEISKASSWSSKNTVDKLCPAFTESGSTVVCEPVEGYPLEVVSHINGSASGVTLQHFQGGIDVDSGDFFTAYIRVASSDWRSSSDSWSVRVLCKPNTTYYISHLNPAETIFRAACVESFAAPANGVVPVVNAVESKTNGILTVTTTQNAVALIIQLAAASQDVTRKTLVVYEGVRTEHHADFGKTVTGGEYNWSSGVLTDESGNTIALEPKTIVAPDGKNGFKSDCGNTTVSGKADPNAIIAKQEVELSKFNKQYELIEDITLDADATSFTRDEDTNGKAYYFDAVRILVEATAAKATSQLIFAGVGIDGNYVIYHQQTNALEASAKKSIMNAENNKGLAEVYVATGYSANMGAMYTKPLYGMKSWVTICKITLSTSSDNAPIPAGTRIRIYAVRG